MLTTILSDLNQIVNYFENRERRDLTVREKEVLGHLVRGHSTKQISHLLSVSVKTIEFHIANIHRKIGTSPLDLVRYALGQGLIQL